jgi:hypothetical protein
MGYPNTDPTQFPKYPPIMPVQGRQGFINVQRLHPFVNLKEVHWPEIIRPVCYGWWVNGCGFTAPFAPQYHQIIEDEVLKYYNTYAANWVWYGQTSIVGVSPFGNILFSYPLWEPPLGFEFSGDCKKKDGTLYRTSKLSGSVEIVYPYRPRGYVLASPKADFESMGNAVETSANCDFYRPGLGYGLGQPGDTGFSPG